MKTYLTLALAGSIVSATAAQATNVVHVTPANMQGWSDVTSESGGGGNAEITGDAYDGNGSVAAHGDRDRFVLGGEFGLYGNPNTDGGVNNLGTLSNFTNLSFSYKVDSMSTSSINPLYGPALRIVFWQGNVKDELVFEQAYQAGGYGAAAPKGTWNVTNTNSTFYLKSNGNENNEKTLAQWVASNNLGGATVGGVYVGVGSGAGSGVFVHYDDIIAGANEYKFDLSAAAAAVPEPATWAMMIGGFGFVGASMRRRSGRPARAA
ncbi:PEPxxWA-CTERM sorting domain-containing protein [Polymorphobacter megasporae]|uniref:PEPxxWA-CTERM sorting domain-containing protein n=1 Tax=Glacieibacterium megasporae TaxID=2835787 RepID=UPI0021057E2B|nr:PEPxxWA-CTERM sorting domain-containing protein [Polymorphobacter megasporae]